MHTKIDLGHAHPVSLFEGITSVVWKGLGSEFAPFSEAIHSFTPMRSVVTHLLVVETQISAPFMRAKVSLGPPRQAAQLGDAGGTAPAASKTSAAVLPSQEASCLP